MHQIKIIVVDNNSLFREGICSILNAEQCMEVRGAATIKDALILMDEFDPNVILLDWSLAECHGAVVSHLLKQNGGEVNVLIITNTHPNKHLLANLQQGAKGCISKEASKKDLILAIKSIAAGNYFLSKDAGEFVTEYLQNKKSNDFNFSDAHSLSKREKDILKYISLGFTNSQIADKLFISSHTVATHRRNLLQKINAKNTAGLVVYASRLGLLN